MSYTNVTQQGVSNPVTLGNAAGTGIITVGSSSTTQTVIIAGGTGATTVDIANAATTGAVNIAAAATTATMTIGGTAQTGTITLGSSSGTNILNLGTGAGATTVNVASGATNAKHVNVGTGAVANILAIGTTTGAASTTISAGSGGIITAGAYGVTSSNPVVATVDSVTGQLGSISVLSAALGGTGVANASTFTIGGNFALSGAYTFTGTLTNTTTVTFPTTGTLATTSQIPSSGSPLVLASGGTSADLTASNGGIFYSSATAGAILAGTATAGQLLTSGASTTPAWTTSTYPATNAVSTLLYASSANVMAALATANSGVLITSAGGVPSISTTIPTTTQGNITVLGTIGTGVWQGTLVNPVYGGTGVANLTGSTLTLGGATAFSGAYATTITVTAGTSVTLPTSGTLVNTGVTSLGSLATVGVVSSGTWSAILKDYTETITTANSTANYAINLANGNWQEITLTANCAFTFSNVPATGGQGVSLTLTLIQDGTGSRTASWPGSVDWGAAGAPTLTTTPGDADVITMITANNGTRWRAFLAGKGFGG